MASQCTYGQVIRRFRDLNDKVYDSKMVKGALRGGFNDRDNSNEGVLKRV